MFKYQYLDGFGRAWVIGESHPAGVAYRYVLPSPRGPPVQEMPHLIAGSEPAVWTTHAYDALNRKVRTQHPDGAIVTTSYATPPANTTTHFDSVTVRDELNRDTTTHRDAFGKPLEITRYLDGSGQAGSGTPNRMTLTYDAFDRLTSVTDAMANVWSATYDSLGRRLTVSDPNHSTWTFAYDAASRLIQQIDARGNRSAYQFDPLGRMSRREHYTSANTLELWHAYKYDFADADKCPNRVAGQHYVSCALLRRAEVRAGSQVAYPRTR